MTNRDEVFEKPKENSITIDPIETPDSIRIFSSESINFEYVGNNLSQILSELQVRTANLDNYRDREKIVSIFTSHFNEDHPLPIAKEMKFWENPEDYLLGETLTSLILEDVNTGEPIAHLALAFREHDTHAEILLPAINSNWKHSIGVIFQKFLSKINQISSRRNWTHYVAACITADPFYQYIATTYFGCHATSLVPKAETELVGDFVIILYSPIKISRYSKPLFLPEKYRDQISSLIKNLRIATLKNERSPTQDNIDIRTNHFTERQLKPWKISKHRLYGLCFMDLRPGILKKPQNVLKLLKNAKKHLGYLPVIRISLSDELTPHVIMVLEPLNLTFCGIDMLNGNIVIVLAEASKNELTKIPLVDHRSISFRNELIQNILS